MGDGGRWPIQREKNFRALPLNRLLGQRKQFPAYPWLMASGMQRGQGWVPAPQPNTGQGSGVAGGYERVSLCHKIMHNGSPGDWGLLVGRSGQECRTPGSCEPRLHPHQTNPKQALALHLDLGPGSATDQLSNFGKLRHSFRLSFLV